MSYLPVNINVHTSAYPAHVISMFSKLYRFVDRQLASPQLPSLLLILFHMFFCGFHMRCVAMAG